MSNSLSDITFEQILAYTKKLESRVSNQQLELDEKKSEIDLMRFEIGQLKRLLFGAKRERFIPMGDSNQYGVATKKWTFS